jgi:hypothetical protein
MRRRFNHLANVTAAANASTVSAILRGDKTTHEIAQFDHETAAEAHGMAGQPILAERHERMADWHDKEAREI